jgi:hypothetical protein
MADITWSAPTGYVQSATATCAVDDVFASGASDGADLTSCATIMVDMTADSEQTITTAGKLVAYKKNPTTALWSPCPELDLTGTTTGKRGHAWAGFEVVGATSGERIAYEPSGVVVSSGSITINITVADAKTEVL